MARDKIRHTVVVADSKKKNKTMRLKELSMLVKLSDILVRMAKLWLV
jgi:hypothetical protein